jgi:DNA processing protein
VAFLALESARYEIAFSHVSGVGPHRLAKLQAHFGDLRSAWHATDGALRRVLGPSSLDSMRRTRRALDVDAALERVARLGLRVVTRRDDAYPDRLRQIPHAPFVLYVKGDVALLSRRGVAVVGTRAASAYGCRAARRLARDIAGSGVTVVSGLALGIDAEAHRAALDVGGPTVAVLGCGPDIAYPPRNRALMDRVARQGAVASEYPPGTPPEAGNFPARNRIVSGLALATVVVEAGFKSGALITARCALDQGRDVFAVPGSVFSEAHAGANALLASGAGVALSAAEVLTALDLAQASVQESVRRRVPSGPTEEALLAALGPEPVHIDDLCRQTGLASAKVAGVLSVMELKGLVQHTGGMRWLALE